jgi:hypothetical protein
MYEDDEEMTEKPVTTRELDLLLATVRYSWTISREKPPDNQWLAEELGICPGGVVNLKHSLKTKGLLDSRFKKAVLTESAKQLLDSLSVINPTKVIVVGQVKAGRTRPDQIEVVMRDISFPVDADSPSITIPQVEKPGAVFALEVVGQSMESENIFEGDYVIVQSFLDSEKPRPGELIIAQYLPICDEEYVNLEEVAAGGDIPDDYLEGPTVKYYYEKEGFYRLSWRRNSG